MNAPAGFERAVVGATVTAAAALSAVGARGLMPTLAAVLAVGLSVATGAALLLWPSAESASRRRTIVQPVVAVGIVAAAVVLIRRVNATAGDPVAMAEGVASTLSFPLAALLIGQLCIAATLRELGITLVASALCVLLVLGTSPKDETPDLGSAVGLLLAVTWAGGLVTLWLLHRLQARSTASYVVPGRSASVAAPVVLVALSVLLGLAALLIPPPEGARGLNGTLGGPPGDGADGLRGSRSAQNYLSPAMDLNTRGSLDDRPLLLVPADSPGLWGSTVLTTYDGRRWGVDPGQVTARLGDPRDASGAWDLRPGAPEGAQPGWADRTDLVRVLDAALPLPIVAPGQAVSVDVASRLARLPGSLAYPVDQPVRGYTVRSTAAVLDRATDADVTLPDQVPARVRELAERLTADADTVHAKVTAIEAYLRDTARYRLDSPVPGEGEEAVDHFLFESQEGFCEHFAAAEVVLLRAVGVPARIVTGFAGGDLTSQGRVLREQDAHAWVQVHVGSGQWIWTDPTAGVALADEGETGESGPSWLRDHAWLVAGVMVSLVLLAGGGWLVVRKVGARRAAARAAAAPLTVKVLVAFAALEAALARSPLARRPETSVEEFRRTLLARWPGGLADASHVSGALDAVQRILYDRTAVTDEEARATLTVLESLAARARDLVTA